ncbi:esterase-like activity of phytase family protein [Kineococcus aurantiacus]|uniref:Phytase-like domain-containing protein n=1 Tax=Kineococcus aurantiacus TaxID=37633 RepID=A0A7Y9J0N9_9ACTN|nr:hypothetical protein [Kineococcus aurantiacus]
MRRSLAALVAATVLVPVTAVTAASAAPSPSATRAAPARCSASVALSGFSDRLDETTSGGQPVAGLSALGRTSDGSLLALSDRSQLFTLDGTTREPVGVVALRDEQGGELDSEGLVVDRDGTLWVSSEVGPAIRHHARDGRVLGSLEVPADFRTAPRGRAQENLSLESLTLSADGLTLFSGLEQGLVGDPDREVRLQTWHRAALDAPFEPGAQYAYQVDPGLGVPEVAATPDGRLLVLEREFLAQVGNTVRLYVTDPATGTDVSAVPVLTGDEALPKTLLADLVTCPALGATAEQPQLNPLLDNVEGMTVLANQGDRRLSVLLVSDDNERPTQTTRLYDLAVTLPVRAG